ncbi:MAG: SDR family oxidoreductase [Planctomycetes bacterium]|nr:SDR family oxidoreductase [Planctomycetota bacterium]
MAIAKPTEPTSCLVFGASGFLGAHVLAAAWNRARRLERAERTRIVGASRVPDAAPHHWRPREAVEFRACDATTDALERALDELRPERIVNAAALSRLADCEREPELAERVNVELPERLARWTARHGARLVHVSTDLVFGARLPTTGGFSEADEPAPVSVYGATKARGEARVRAQDPRALVVRLPLLFGDSGGRALGASDSLVAAVKRGEVPLLFRDEWRTPLDVSNAAEALVELAYGDASGVLHVGGPVRLSRVELGHLVLRAAGKKSAELFQLVRAGTRAEAGLAATRPSDVSLATERALGLLETTLLAPREALARRAAGLFRTIP